MKKKMVTALLAVSMLAGLSAVNVMAADDDTITVGFSQVGAESDWRTANTESMKSTFSEDNGYELIFDDAQQKQENQLTAIRNFIQQEVDYIVLAPVTETGWDTVLQEAKDAGIPVIIVDRMVDVSDDSLYTAWVGSNFKQSFMSFFSKKSSASSNSLEVTSMRRAVIQRFFSYTL